MTISLTISAVLALFVLFFTWANRSTRRQHALFTKRDVVVALEEGVDNSSRHDTFDLFLGWPINDPYLETVRQRTLQICQNPVQEAGRDLSVTATEQLYALLREVRAQT